MVATRAGRLIRMDSRKHGCVMKQQRVVFDESFYIKLQIGIRFSMVAKSVVVIILKL